MAGKTQDQLYESFVDAAGGESSSLREVLDRTTEIAASLAEALGTATTPGTQASGGGQQVATANPGLYGESATSFGSDVRGTTSSTSSSGGGGSTIGSVVSTFFESGFGMAALVKGLFGLFGGGSSAPPPLEKYEMPPAIQFSSAETASGMSAADYDQTGAPRNVGPVGGESFGGTANAAPQITVNVQAMDAQSFLDHSDAIAQAVRGAMLNMSSINDVVNEL